MYIIVAGGGVLGLYTTQFMSKKGNDVIVIEENKDRAEELSDKLDATVLCGDAKEIKILEEAGVEQADVFLALTGSDDTNILIGILAKQLGAKRTICRITHIEYSESIFKKLGIDAVVYPELTFATELEEMVRDPDVSGFALLDDGDTEMIELKIHDASQLVGTKLSKLKLPKGSQVMSIIHSNKEREAACPETVLNEGDKVLILTNKSEISEVERVFSK